MFYVPAEIDKCSVGKSMRKRAQQTSSTYWPMTTLLQVLQKLMLTMDLRWLSTKMGSYGSYAVNRALN